MSELNVPLLSKDREDAGPSSAEIQHQDSSHRIPPPPRPINWWRKLLHQLTHLWDTLLDFLYWNGWTRFISPSPTPSILLASKLESLQQRIAIPYDAQRSEHQDHLRRLWVSVFPSEPFPEGIKSPQWKLMGWQGSDPGSDFRGGGFLALELLVYFAENDPREFQALMGKERGVRSEWEYPFAAAGVNLTFMLVECLDLRGIDRAPMTPAGQGFLRLLSTSDDAFEVLFIETFVLLDKVWLEHGATYMEFPIVLKEVRTRVERTMRRRWLSSLGDLKALHL